MNVLRSRVVLRPRGALELVDLSLLVLRDWWTELVPLLAVFALPAWLGLLALVRVGPAVAFLVAVETAFFLEAVLTLAFGRILFGEPAGVRVVASEVGGGLPRVFLVMVIQSAATGVSLLSFGLFAVPAVLATAFVPQVLLLERLPVRRALGRSANLALLGLGRTLAWAMAATAMGLWVVMLAVIAGSVLVDEVVGWSWEDVDHIGSPWFLGGLLAAAVVVSTTRFLFYLDTRTRLEAWDLQVALHPSEEP